MSQLIINDTTAPSAPAAGKKTIYTKSTGSLFYKDSAGVEERLLDDRDVVNPESIINLYARFYSGI